MAKDDMTLEKLAQMVHRGFEQTARKADLELLATKAEMNERFDRVELHISSLGSDWRERFDALEMRVRKLEHRR
jgi:hypothetical protein